MSVFVVLVIVSTSWASASAQSTVTTTIEVDIGAIDGQGVFEYTSVFDRINLAAPQNADSWSADDPGIYVGSHVPEANFGFTHGVEDPTLAEVRFEWDVLFSSADIGSAVSVLRMRLPFDIDDTSTWIVSLTVRDEGEGLTLIDKQPIFVASTPSINGDIAEENGRWYLYVRTIIHSDALISFTLFIENLALGDTFNIYLTDDDVAMDGIVGGNVVIVDKFAGVPETLDLDLLADLGVSYMMIEMSPKHGYVGFEVTTPIAGTSEVIRLRMDAIDLSSATPWTDQTVMFHLPAYTFNGLIGRADVTVKLICGSTTVLTSGPKLHDFTEGIFVRESPVTIPAQASTCAIVADIVPIHANAERLIIMAQQTVDLADRVGSDGDFIAATDIDGATDIWYVRPSISFTFYDAPNAEPTYNPFPAPIGFFTDILPFNIGRHSSSFMGTFISNAGGLAVCGQKTASMILTLQAGVAGDATRCIRNLPVVQSAEQAVADLNGIVADICGGTISGVLSDPLAFAQDCKDGVLNIASNIMSTLLAMGKELVANFLETIFAPFGKLQTTVTLVLEKTFFLLETILAIGIYLAGLGILMMFIWVALAFIVILKLILTGRGALVPSYLRNNLSIRDIRRLDR